MKKNVIHLVFFIFFLSLITGCRDEKVESKNMEQIFKEEGVPVRVEKIRKSNFKQDLTFNSILTGIKESSASSMIGGRIEKVLVSVGDFVKKDQVLVTFPSDNPSTQYFQAKVAFENAASTYERYKTLFSSGGISAQNLDNIKTQYEVNKANWETIQKMVNVLAPISGYVTKVAVMETDDVKKETVLVTIADLSKMKANIQVSENEINEISSGTTAYALWHGKRMDGEVTQVDMAMNPMTQAFNAVVEFDNKNNQFKPGVTVDIIVEGSSKNETITVERKNLVKRGNDYFAFTVEGNLAKEKKVELGNNKGIYVEVINGLNENELLVTEGNMFLENESLIKIIK